MSLTIDPAPVRRVEPLSSNWRSVSCAGGVFDMAHRPKTALVEGVIRTPHHLVLVTLGGGAERLTVSSDCGHRYEGQDRPGLVSFVPAHCERRLSMVGVRSQWASLSLSPGWLASIGGDRMAPGAFTPGAFTNVEDAFLSGMVREMARLMQAEGGFDVAYAETMAAAAGHHLLRRHGTLGSGQATGKLAPWQRRRVEAFIEANLAGEIRIADLAAEIGLSPGHFHRVWRAGTGQSPLAAINAARVRRALTLLAVERGSIAEIALRVGFLSPSHFTRVFRGVTGRAPSALRRG